MLSIASSNYTCPIDGSLEELQTAPFVGSLTFYHFNLILSGAAMALSCLVCFSSIILHATHLSKPGEQLKIIRIAMFIPFYSIWSYLILAFPKTQSFLLPWREFVEAMALATFFILLCEFISPSSDEREIFFAGLELPKKKDGTPNTQDPLSWYRRKWISVFQFPVVALLVAIVTDITEAAGRYCLTSYNIHFAHLWMVIIINVSLVACVMSIFLFYKALKPELNADAQRPLAKFFAFKGIIALTFLINILFAILNGANALKPTATLNYADITVGIPTLIVLLALVPFSFFFHYAYSHRAYIIREGAYTDSSKLNNSGSLASFKPTYQGGPLGCRAYIYAINPSEVLRGIAFAFSLFSQEASDRAAARGSDGRGRAGRLLDASPNGSGRVARDPREDLPMETYGYDYPQSQNLHPSHQAQNYTHGNGNANAYGDGHGYGAQQIARPQAYAPLSR